MRRLAAADPQWGDPSALRSRAIQALRDAALAGFIDAGQLAKEPRFDPLRDQPEFENVVSNIAEAAKTRTWFIDIEKAQLVAQQTDRDLLVFIDGSDWCVYCRTVRGEILDQKEFLDAITRHFVLVDIDDPMFKEKPPFHARNQRLLQRWHIGGRPTFVYCDSQQRRLLSHGGGGSVEQWIARAAEVRRLRIQRDLAIDALSDASAEEKLELVAKALAGIPTEFHDEDYGELQHVLKEYVQSGPHKLNFQESDPILLRTLGTGHLEYAAQLRSQDSPAAAASHSMAAREIFAHLYAIMPDDLLVATQQAVDAFQVLSTEAPQGDDAELRAELIATLSPQQAWYFVGGIDYLNGEFERAAEAFQRVDGERRVPAAILMTLTHLATGNEARARDAYSRLARRRAMGP